MLRRARSLVVTTCRGEAPRREALTLAAARTALRTRSGLKTKVRWSCDGAEPARYDVHPNLIAWGFSAITSGLSGNRLITELRAKIGELVIEPSRMLRPRPESRDEVDPHGLNRYGNAAWSWRSFYYAPGREPVEPAPDAVDRRAVHGDAVMARVKAGGTRSLDQRCWGCTQAGRLAAPGAQDLSRPRVVHGLVPLHLSVSGGLGRKVLSWRLPTRSMEFLRRGLARALRRSSTVIHQRRLHRCADGHSHLDDVKGRWTVFIGGQRVREAPRPGRHRPGLEGRTSAQLDVAGRATTPRPRTCRRVESNLQVTTGFHLSCLSGRDPRTHVRQLVAKVLRSRSVCSRWQNATSDVKVSKRARCSCITPTSSPSCMKRRSHTNNVAERALRTAVQWRKIMFGNRSVEGERAVARLLTVTRTCQLQQLHVT